MMTKMTGKVHLLPSHSDTLPLVALLFFLHCSLPLPSVLLLTNLPSLSLLTFPLSTFNFLLPFLSLLLFRFHFYLSCSPFLHFLFSFSPVCFISHPGLPLFFPPHLSSTNITFFFSLSFLRI